MWQWVEILNVLNTLTLKQIFWQKKSFSKNWSIVFYLKALRLKTHHFHTKTTISEANVKTNRIVSTKWTYHRDRSFASNYFMFLKILFQFKNCKELIWCTSDSYVHICTFCKGWSYIWRCFFPVSILNNYNINNNKRCFHGSKNLQ